MTTTMEMILNQGNRNLTNGLEDFDLILDINEDDNEDNDNNSSTDDNSTSLGDDEDEEEDEKEKGFSRSEDCTKQIVSSTSTSIIRHNSKRGGGRINRSNTREHSGRNSIIINNQSSTTQPSRRRRSRRRGDRRPTEIRQQQRGLKSRCKETSSQSQSQSRSPKQSPTRTINGTLHNTRRSKNRARKSSSSSSSSPLPSSSKSSTKTTTNERSIGKYTAAADVVADVVADTDTNTDGISRTQDIPTTKAATCHRNETHLPSSCSDNDIHNTTTTTTTNRHSPTMAASHMVMKNVDKSTAIIDGQPKKTDIIVNTLFQHHGEIVVEEKRQLGSARTNTILNSLLTMKEKKGRSGVGTWELASKFIKKSLMMKKGKNQEPSIEYYGLMMSMASFSSDATNDLIDHFGGSFSCVDDIVNEDNITHHQSSMTEQQQIISSN